MRFGIRTRARQIARQLIVTAMPPSGTGPVVVVKDDAGRTVVDDYWNEHTLHQAPFLSAKESERYLRKRNSEYPLFPELMDLYGDHRGEVVLDYGCGPG